MVDPALRAIVRLYEYEDWPRGRIVFDRLRDLFVLYADRKLMTPEMIAHIQAQFHLPEDRTETILKAVIKASPVVLAAAHVAPEDCGIPGWPRTSGPRPSQGLL
jgi:hypothetical protein